LRWLRGAWRALRGAEARRTGPSAAQRSNRHPRGGGDPRHSEALGSRLRGSDGVPE
jgi:hypothetical protein